MPFMAVCGYTWSCLLLPLRPLLPFTSKDLGRAGANFNEFCRVFGWRVCVTGGKILLVLADRLCCCCCLF